MGYREGGGVSLEGGPSFGGGFSEIFGNFLEF